jgi:hypothetical protein
MIEWRRHCHEVEKCKNVGHGARLHSKNHGRQHSYVCLVNSEEQDEKDE